MPELDGVSIVAFAAFALLVVAWLVAPTRGAAAEEDRRYRTAA